MQLLFLRMCTWHHSLQRANQEIYFSEYSFILWNGCMWTGLLLLCLSYSYSLCSCTLCNMCIFAGVLEQFFWYLQEHHSKSEFLVAIFELISLQTHTFVKSTTGIYYSERYFSLLTFCFFVPHTLGQQY